MRSYGTSKLRLEVVSPENVASRCNCNRTSRVLGPVVIELSTSTMGAVTLSLMPSHDSKVAETTRDPHGTPVSPRTSSGRRPRYKCEFVFSEQHHLANDIQLFIMSLGLSTDIVLIKPTTIDNQHLIDFRSKDAGCLDGQCVDSAGAGLQSPLTAPLYGDKVHITDI